MSVFKSSKESRLLQSHSENPPRVPQWILRKLIDGPAYHEFTDDVEEVYRIIAAQRGLRRAGRWYWRRVLESMPGMVLDFICWRFVMFHNLIKLTVRHFVKQRVYNLIGTLGLALAVGCFTVPYLYIDTNNRFDAFHEHADAIYYVESMIERNDDSRLYGVSPMPLGPAMAEAFPQVADFVRIRVRDGVVRYGTALFTERLMFVDDAFFNVFTFPLREGDPDVLRDRNAVAITETCAEKYFGQDDPIGKELLLIRGEYFRRPFIVKAVVKDHPMTSSFRFDMLLPFALFLDWEGQDLNDWGAWAHTFIHVPHSQSMASLGPMMDEFIVRQNAANTAWSIRSFVFEPLIHMARNAYKVSATMGFGFPLESKIGLGLFGLFILSLACFNYMNIGIVTATQRLREIGVRKALGGSRTSLVIQFFSEHLLLCFVAVVLGVLFSLGYLIPHFNRMFPAYLRMDFFHDLRLWIFLVSTFIITGLGSGAYPAIYVSRFRPVQILRKTQPIGGGSRSMKIFMIGQCVLTFMMICTALIFIRNAAYQKRIDWGYDQDMLIVVPVDGVQSFRQYRDYVSQSPLIIDMAGSHDHVGKSWDTEVIKVQGTEYEWNRFNVGSHYLSTMRMRLKSGRGFDENLSTDDRSILVNEKLMRTMGWVHPLGQHVSIGDEAFVVIGVVEDFHYVDFTMPLEPAFFRRCTEDEYRYLSIRASAGKAVQTITFLEQAWKHLFPHRMFDGFFQESIFEDHFKVNDNVNRLTSFAAAVALIISSMGLFGLISFSTLRRSKEVSIRKVAGASTAQIIRLLNRDLVVILLVSTLVAVPLSYFLMNWYMAFSYETRAPMSAVPFFAAAAVLFLTSILTVLTQVIKTARSPIVDHLRDE